MVSDFLFRHNRLSASQTAQWKITVPCPSVPVLRVSECPQAQLREPSSPQWCVRNNRPNSSFL